MTRLLLLILGAAASVAPQAGARTLDEIVTALESAPRWHATAEYSVSMPQMLDDVYYRLDMESWASPADTLAPCAYVIDWSLEAEDAPVSGSTGFSAYADGHHYRYASGRRMQEYHMDWDSIPFIPRLAGSSKAVAVQKSARFCELLPQMLAEQLRVMQSDPAYHFVIHPDTVAGGWTGCVVVDMRRTVDGNDGYAQEGEYVFDGTTLMPLRITMENNPGSIAEQTVMTTYHPAETVGDYPAESALASRYPEVFAQWRESNYRIETLPGHRLPEFSLPDIDGTRMERSSADQLAAPTLIVVYDPEDSFTRSTVEDVRQAMAELPVAAEVIFAALTTSAEQVEEAVPGRVPGEHRLFSARGLARDCGVASTPTLIFVGRDGVVNDVIVGYNNTLRTDVIQKMSH